MGRAMGRAMGNARRGRRTRAGRCGREPRAGKAHPVLVKSDRSLVMFPVLSPCGRVAYQTGRGDVHTAVLNGHVANYDRELLEVDLAKARRVVEAGVEHALQLSQHGKSGRRSGPTRCALSCRTLRRSRTRISPRGDRDPLVETSPVRPGPCR